MDFQKYINHNQTAQVPKPSSNKKTQQNPRVIKFVGNMQENIKQLLQNINCHCGNKKQFYNILLVFSNKIEKLRKQRQHYKTTLKQYLLAMNNSSSLKDQHFSNQRKNETERKSKTLVKRESPQITKSYMNNKENQTPLKKVTDLFMNEKSKTVCLKEKLTPNTEIKENLQLKKHLTAVKKIINDDLVNEFRTIDKRMNDFYEIKKTQEINELKIEENNDDGSFSFNLSSFEETDTKQQPTQQFTKEISIILNETNLLDSDDQEKDLPQFKTPCKKQILKNEIQIENLKPQRKSTEFQEILLSLNTEQDLPNSEIMKPSKKISNSSQKKENPQQVTTTVKKPVRKAQKHNDKENIKGQSCLKKYNITLQKLQQFIETKECLRQLQKTQHYDLNLKSFKSYSTNLFNRKPATEYESLRQTIRPIKPLQQRKFNFN